MIRQDKFEELLSGLRCVGCEFYRDECTHENRDEFNENKEKLRLAFGEMYDEGIAATPDPRPARLEMLNKWKDTFEDKNKEMDKMYICDEYEMRKDVEDKLK